MNIVVNDTNIFIDLDCIGLLEHIRELPITFHTVDYVLHEIEDERQMTSIKGLINNGGLFVKEFDEKESEEIANTYMARSNNVSITDCAVWVYAKNNNFRLLTGDGKLKASAIEDGVLVSGILFLIDRFVEEGVILRNDMADRLEKLISINKRLPKKLIEERILMYRNNLTQSD